MTQMMLFDAPQTTSFPVASTASVSEGFPAVQPVSSTSAPHHDAPRAKDPREKDPREKDGGLHHMGDLARLVLLRYELMAKRRARRAARAAAAC